MSEATVVHVPEEQAYEISLEGEAVGFTAYAELPGKRIFFHTEVDDDYEGQGLASRLVRAAAAETRDAGLRIMATCPYWRRWLQSHHDFDDIVDNVSPDAIQAVRQAQE
jgi:predicted GNAT family acetyltransferase